MSARASGTDAGDSSGSAKQRSHHDGSSSRSYTVEQKATVIRVRRCSPTAFYDILGLEEVKTTCSEGEIKKAYRKLSLLTHPDKNGYVGADEAFKLVSKAFQILSDPDKKSRYDKFGGDPDSRHSAASAAASGFGRASARGGSGGDWSPFEEEMSPEELFRQFFGGGMGGGFPGFAFDTGPQFVFNVGGGPGFRVHQFGGGRPQRRPGRVRTGPDGRPIPDEGEGGIGNFIATILPILLLFVLPLITSLFSSGSASGPVFEFQKTSSASLTKRFTSEKFGVDYYVNPQQVRDLSKRQRADLDHRAEIRKVGELQQACNIESVRRQQMVDEAHGWFSVDQDMLEKARKMKMQHCEELQEFHKRGLRI